MLVLIGFFSAVSDKTKMMKFCTILCVLLFVASCNGETEEVKDCGCGVKNHFHFSLTGSEITIDPVMLQTVGEKVFGGKENPHVIAMQTQFTQLETKIGNNYTETAATLFRIEAAVKRTEEKADRIDANTASILVLLTQLHAYVLSNLPNGTTYVHDPVKYTIVAASAWTIQVVIPYRVCGFIMPSLVAIGGSVLSYLNIATALEYLRVVPLLKDYISDDFVQCSAWLLNVGIVIATTISAFAFQVYGFFNGRQTAEIKGMRQEMNEIKSTQQVNQAVAIALANQPTKTGATTLLGDNAFVPVVDTTGPAPPATLLVKSEANPHKPGTIAWYGVEATKKKTKS